jgi:hypothetical protein
MAPPNLLSTIINENKLTGANYETWKRNLKIVLTIEKHILALNEPIPPVPDANATMDENAKYVAWCESDKMCKCYILASLDTILQKQVENMLSASEIMLYLSEMFEGKSRVTRYLTIKNLVSTKMTEGKPVRDHMLKMFGYIQELASTYDVALEAKIQSDIFLASLPASFDGFVTNYTLNGKLLTNSELLGALQAAEDSMTARGQTLNVEHKTALRPKGKLKKAKKVRNKPKAKPGPFAAAAPNSEDKGKPKGKCFKCGMKGHWKADCREVKTVHKGTSQSFMIEVLSSFVSDVSWVLDSGSTNHTCNSLQGFKETRRLDDGEITLSMGT